MPKALACCWESSTRSITSVLGVFPTSLTDFCGVAALRIWEFDDCISLVGPPAVEATEFDFATGVRTLRVCN